MRTNERAKAGRAAVRRVRLPGVLRWFWVGSAAAFGLTFLVGWVEWRVGLPRGRWDPLLGAMLDLKEYVGTYRLLHAAGFFFGTARGSVGDSTWSAVAYPPFAAAVMAPLYAAGRPVVMYLMVAAVALGVGVWGVRGALVREGIGGGTALMLPLTLMVMSFPMVRMVWQGNIELVVWVFAAGGCVAFVRGREDVAGALWGLAAAMKLYPVMLLVLLVGRRRYRALGVGVGSFVGATLLSLWWLGPSVGTAWHGSVQNVFGYQGLRAGEWTLRELAANHSAFELVKVGAMVVGAPMGRLTGAYYACGAAVFAVAWFGRLRKMPVTNQLLGVTVFMVLLPTVSYFHALVHVYAPLVMLMILAIRAERAGVRVRGLGVTLMLFVPLLGSFTLFTFPRVYLFGGLVQAGLLVGLFACAVRFRLAVGNSNGNC